MIWVLVAAAVIVLIVLLIAYVCFYMAFYTARKKQEPEFSIPEGQIYEPYREQMVAWMKELRRFPCRDVEITAFDGLKLRGRFFEYAPGAPIELMFHGYRGNADRDLCGGVQRCFALGRSALIVDQRACGSSEGHVITFGIYEHRDCLAWLEYMQEAFGSEVKILITGISMGASTVLLAAGQPLPANVVGVLADCGFTSARDIIQSVIRQMKLPPKLAYPFVRLGARLYGGFDPDADSARDAMGRCRIPVLFIHGEADDFVPCSMSAENHAACVAHKKLVTVPRAGHGLSYLVDPEGYLQALREFFDPILKEEVQP